MPDELLYSVRGPKAERIRVISLAEAGLKERQDLQEWVVASPEILGPDVMVVAVEFNHWKATTGEQPQDRLDVLGLDQDGRLVIAELKRDRAPDTMEMQAIKYAAMSSRFTPEAVAEQFARFSEARGQALTVDEALEQLFAHAPDLSVETLLRPKIVLLASDFPRVLTATAVWLTEMGLDISLVTFQAYQTESETLLSVSRMFPVPDVEEFTVAPQLAVARESRETRSRQRDMSAVRRLVQDETLPDGEQFFLQIRNGVKEDARDAIARWVAEDDARQYATWQNDSAAPLVWQADGASYSPTGLAKHIIFQASGLEVSVHGTRWWVNELGEDLTQLAAQESGGKGSLYQKFWTQFLDRIEAERPEWMSTRVPTVHSWIRMANFMPRTAMCVAFTGNGRLRSELYISSGSASASMSTFNHFESHKVDIEAVFGEPLSWEPLPGKKACRIATYTTADIFDEEAYDSYIDWYIEATDRLRPALQQFAPR